MSAPGRPSTIDESANTLAKHAPMITAGLPTEQNKNFKALFPQERTYDWTGRLSNLRGIGPESVNYRAEGYPHDSGYRYW